MVNKQLITKLINNYDIDVVEHHLVLSFLNSQNLAFDKSKFITEYLESKAVDTSLLAEISAAKIKDLKELENYLELIIPLEDRQLNGAFFTPTFISDFIIKTLQPLANEKCLDPSCGCGAFLIGLLDHFRINSKKSIRKILKENIFGADILAYNVRRTKLLLCIYGLQQGENVQLSDLNIFYKDSLRDSWSDKFDCIVGNPPYVKFQDLNEENRTFLSSDTWLSIQGGTFNLYFAFFELGYKLLSENGRLGYITPNNYFTSLSGESLRKFFQSKHCVYQIIDFSHKKVFEAQTYTALTFLNNKNNDNILYDRIATSDGISSFLQQIKLSENNVHQLSTKKWRLLKTEEQENIYKIEHSGSQLGKIVDICVGIATLKDDVFFVQDQDTKKYLKKVTDKGTFQIEIAATKPLYKISDFKNQTDLELNKRRIIFPYTIKGKTASVIPEAEFLEKFPKCYDYLISEKEKLGSRDKGKSSIIPFYAWGRTQGLTRLGIKIITPTFSQFPRFLIINEEDSYFTNGYGIFFKNDYGKGLLEDESNLIAQPKNADVLLKILNSLIMHYYVSKTSVSIEGGYPCYQKNFIEKFTIPSFDAIEIGALRKLTNKEEIDRFLIRKYQLNLIAGNLAE